MIQQMMPVDNRLTHICVRARRDRKTGEVNYRVWVRPVLGICLRESGKVDYLIHCPNEQKIETYFSYRHSARPGDSNAIKLIKDDESIEEAIERHKQTALRSLESAEQQLLTPEAEPEPEPSSIKQRVRMRAEVQNYINGT